MPVGHGDGGYAVFLGRMCPDKGVDAAVRIARAAGMHLKIAAKLAEPAEREYFRTCVEPLLGPDAEYVGEVGGDEKWELLGEATCLLNPLRWSEPFGMVMIEALATGTPVVATPNGSVPEIVTDGVNGFIRAIRARARRRRPPGQRLDRTTCRRIVADEFSITHMVRKHIRLFETVTWDERRARPFAMTPQRAACARRASIRPGTRDGVTNPPLHSLAPPYPLWADAPASRRKRGRFRVWVEVP